MNLKLCNKIKARYILSKEIQELFKNTAPFKFLNMTTVQNSIS